MRPKQDSRTGVFGSTHGCDVLELTPVFTFGTYRNVTIAIWRSTPTVVALQRIDVHLTRFIRNHKKFGSIVVLEPTNFSPPDQKAREEHASLTKKYEEMSIGVAMIIDGRTVKETIYRFVLSTTQLLSSPRVPERVFSSVPAATAWVATLDHAIDPTDLRNAVKEIRTVENARAHVG
jgi:hypothetical protein